MSYFEEYDYRIHLEAKDVDRSEFANVLNLIFGTYGYDPEKDEADGAFLFELEAFDAYGRIGAKDVLAKATRVEIHARDGEVGGVKKLGDGVLDALAELGNGSWATLSYDSDFGSYLDAFGAAKLGDPKPWKPEGRAWFSNACAELYLTISKEDLSARTGVPVEDVAEVFEAVDEYEAALAARAFGPKASFAFDSDWDFSELVGEEDPAGKMELKATFLSCHELSDDSIAEYGEFAADAEASGGCSYLEYEGEALCEIHGMALLKLDHDSGRTEFSVMEVEFDAT